MKKSFSTVICLLIVVVFLTSCQSEEAIRVDKIISDIGTVTLDSKDELIDAAEDVLSLDEEDQNQLRNADKLIEMINEYAVLVNEEKAKNVEKLIYDIGEASLDNTEKFEKAKSAYDESPKEVKDLISNYNIIEEYEKELSNLKVEKVISLIKDIGEVSESSTDKIEKAEKAYEKLSSEEKEKVTNFSTIKQAKEKIKSIKKSNAEDRMNNALSKLKEEYDDVTETSFYYPYSRPNYVNNRCYVLPHLGGKNSNIWLCITADYFGKDWIFYDTLIINADGKIYTKKLKYYDVERKHNNGTVAEFYNAVCDINDITWIKAIADADNAIIRFEGTDYYDLSISENDKNEFKKVVDAYEAAKEYRELS